jgi:hypothetical protein
MVSSYITKFNSFEGELILLHAILLAKQIKSNMKQELLQALCHTLEKEINYWFTELEEE